jgi:hypothetical protein
MSEKLSSEEQLLHNYIRSVYVNLRIGPIRENIEMVTFFVAAV